MNHIDTIAALSNQVNIVLRLAAAAYDQTTLLKQALVILTASTRLEAEDAARFRELMQDVQGSEQEASHVLQLMMARRLPSHEDG